MPIKEREREAVLLPHYPASPLSQTAPTWGFTSLLNAHAVVYPLVITGYTYQSISHHFTILYSCNFTQVYINSILYSRQTGF